MGYLGKLLAPSKACWGHVCSGLHPVNIWLSPRWEILQTFLSSIPVLHHPSSEKKKILITSNNFPHCVWCLLFCPVIVFLLELGFNFIHTVFSLAATKSPDILHSQTKTSPSKTFSEDGQVHPCHHPHSRFAVFLHPSLEPLHCLDQWMSSVLKQSQPLSSFKEVRESAVLHN